MTDDRDSIELDGVEYKIVAGSVTFAAAPPRSGPVPDPRPFLRDIARCATEAVGLLDEAVANPTAETVGRVQVGVVQKIEGMNEAVRKLNGECAP